MHLLPHTILLTIDVTSLYTNIPHTEGIEAYIEALQQFDLPHKPPHDIIEMLMTYTPIIIPKLRMLEY